MQEPVSLGPQDCMFQGDAFRPGDLVWVLLSNPEGVTSQQQQSAAAAVPVDRDSCMAEEGAPEAAPPIQAQQHQQGSEQHVPTMDAGPAFTAACAAIVADGAKANATASCGCIVQSCFLDSGCTAKLYQDFPGQQAVNPLLSTSGLPPHK